MVNITYDVHCLLIPAALHFNPSVITTDTESADLWLLKSFNTVIGLIPPLEDMWAHLHNCGT